MTKPDYPVGKGRPPVHSRFRPGQSGNPSGRPKRANDLTALLGAELESKVTVVERGRERQITKAKYIVNRLVNDAAQGKPQAVKTVTQLMQSHPPPKTRDVAPKRTPQARITQDMSAREAAELWVQVLREVDFDLD